MKEISPYKNSPNPQEAPGGEPFFRVGDRVVSRGDGKLKGTVSRVKLGSEIVDEAGHQLWMERLTVDLDRPTDRGHKQDYYVLAQHYDLVARARR